MTIQQTTTSVTIPSVAPLHVTEAVERPAKAVAKRLLVLLHGVGANERSLLPFAQAMGDDVAVVLPRGPLVLGPSSFAWFQVTFGPQGPSIQPEQAEGSRQGLRDFIAAQQARLSIPAERTVVAGFSQGGIMSAGVALTEPDLVAGFGLISGRILPEIAPLVPANIAERAPQGLVLHGKQDGTLPFSHAQASCARLDALGVPYRFAAYEEGHSLNAAMAADFQSWFDEITG